MNLRKKLLCRVCKMSHCYFDSLSVNILCADDVISLCDLWELVCQALTVKVLLGVGGLVLHNLVGYHDVAVAGLLASC